MNDHATAEDVERVNELLADDICKAADAAEAAKGAGE